MATAASSLTSVAGSAVSFDAFDAWVLESPAWEEASWFLAFPIDCWSFSVVDC